MVYELEKKRCSMKLNVPNNLEMTIFRITTKLFSFPWHVSTNGGPNGSISFSFVVHVSTFAENVNREC